jgi:hypothetical protein
MSNPPDLDHASDAHVVLAIALADATGSGDEPICEAQRAMRLLLFLADALQLGGDLGEALVAATSQTVAKLRSDLEHAHLPATRDGLAEMYAVGAYLCGLPDRQDISADAWALVLAALPAVRQTQLQALLDAIDAELERIILAGDQDPGAERAARRAVDVLEPARALVAGLPWTTLEPDPATDEHARRRATLSVEVEWEREERSPVPVVWFVDGYQTPVCIMRVHVDLQCLVGACCETARSSPSGCSTTPTVWPRPEPCSMRMAAVIRALSPARSGGPG